MKTIRNSYDFGNLSISRHKRIKERIALLLTSCQPILRSTLISNEKLNGTLEEKYRMTDINMNMNLSPQNTSKTLCFLTS